MRAQTIALDLIIGLSLALVVGVVVLNLGLSKSEDPIVRKDAESLSGALFKPFPKDWNMTSVIIPGFVSDQKLNITQLDLFANLSNQTVKTLTGVRSDYFINVTRGDEVLGTAGTSPGSDADLVYTINRFAAYNGSIVRVRVVTWE